MLPENTPGSCSAYCLPTPVGLFRTAAAQPGRHISPQPGSVQGVSPFLVQDSAFVLAEFNKVSVGPFLQHVKVFLDGSPPHQHVNCTPNLVSSADLLSNHHSVISSLLRTIKRTGSTGQTLWYSTRYSCCWPLGRAWSINHCPLGQIIQSISCLLIQTETCKPG